MVSFVDLLDAEGVMRAQRDRVPLRGLRATTYWVAGDIILHAHELTLPLGVPAGRHRFDGGMYPPEAARHLLVSDIDR
jgi:hypothetical protein